MAFAGDLETKSNAVSESGFSLEDVTVSVSTLMLLAAGAVVVWLVRCCFWAVFGAKKEDEREQVLADYGTL